MGPLCCSMSALPHTRSVIPNVSSNGQSTKSNIGSKKIVNKIHHEQDLSKAGFGDKGGKKGQKNG